MKNRTLYLTLALLIFIISGCGSKPYDGSDLVLKDGLLYRGNQAEPYTGKVIGKADFKTIEYYVLNGKKNGEFILRYRNNNVQMKGKIINNKNEGTWNYYYPDGVLESTGNFKNDLPDGIWKWFFGEGTLKETGKFVAGKREGKWLSYNSDGSLYISREFKENIQVDSALAM